MKPLIKARTALHQHFNVNNLNLFPHVSAFFCQAQTETPGVPSWRAVTTAGNHAAAPCGSGVQRGAPTAVPQNGALIGAQTEIATRGTGEENRPETPRTTGEEATESGIAEITESEVG